MKRVLCMGGGVQTTAMAIMVSRGEIPIDEVVFADTGAEKPETYWFMEHYILPLFAQAEIPFTTVKGLRGNLVEYCEHYKVIPSVVRRWCSANTKVRPIKRHIGKDAIMLIGFSADEAHRAAKDIHKEKEFPLIDLGITSSDCRAIISEFGWPIPTKSSCFFCPFQRWTEWNWLKVHHPELIERALDMERHFYSRRPDLRERIGLFGGKPLWKWANGTQMEFEFPGEYDCWSGYCGH